MSNDPKKVDILCTLGPSSFNGLVIKRLEELGVALFRINLSHTRIEDLEDTINLIRKYTQVPICLDSEGAQIRTGDFVVKEFTVHENNLLKAHRFPVPGDAANINFYPLDIIERLEVGDLISIDFNAVLVQVISKEKAFVVLRVLNGGKIGRNKAVTVERDIDLPVLTPKDITAFEIGRRLGIKDIALSFANRPEDVTLIRKHCLPGTRIIAKIECRNALDHLEGIAKQADDLLIDRGDLSRQVPIERIASMQKLIIQTVKRLNKKVFVATNLLESMIQNSKPTRAEVNDVFNTLEDGASGLVLAAETAIGNDPIACANMIVKIVREYSAYKAGEDVKSASFTPSSLLVPPHGGILVDAEIYNYDPEALRRHKRIQVQLTDLMDCEQIAVGTYSPLKGFMDRATLDSVLHSNRLPGGLVWTMPIVLQVSDQTAASLSIGDSVVLTDDQGHEYALLELQEIYKPDLTGVVRDWFGTTDLKHPGVKRICSGGAWFLAGPVRLLKRIESSYMQYQLTPFQCRFIFEHKGWSKVVGFHTRNVAHGVHEYIQKTALQQTCADGLFISPVVGPKKSGDFLPDVILKSYQLSIDFGFYPQSKVVLGCFSTYPRYCGPREAVFTMLCRKNMGCSHFIVGRNHAGVGDYYPEQSYRELFDSLGDLGIQPVFFPEIGYDPETKSYQSTGVDKKKILSISGTEMRKSLITNQPLPNWFLRNVIQEMIRTHLALKVPVFADDSTVQ